MNIEKLELKRNPQLIITKEIQSQINFLHRKIEKTEWSGILFFKVIEGSIKTPTKLVLKAHSLYLMDIGNSAYTEYSSGQKLVEAFDTIEGSELMSYGHIHTHHNMSTFFSKTDDDELVDNAKNFNYYLSLIVNFDFKYKAAIAIETEVSRTLNLFDEDHKSNEITTKSKSIIKIDCDIIFEEPSFETANTYKEVVKEAAKKKALLPKIPTYGKLNFPNQTALFEEEYLGHCNSQINSNTETELLDDDETGALSILSSINISYAAIEELTASIIAMNLNCDETVSDVMDKNFKNKKELSTGDKDEIEDFASMAINAFMDFNNIDLPENIIHDAVIECLEINKDLSTKPTDNYNELIEEYIDAIIYVEMV